MLDFWLLAEYKKKKETWKNDISFYHLLLQNTGIEDEYVHVLVIYNSKNSISGILTSQLKHIWIQNTNFKQNQQWMCFWREWRSYLGTSACVMMGLSRGAAATTTTVSGKHFVSCSRGILTGQRHNLKCSQFHRSTQTWSSEMRRQLLARAIKEEKFQRNLSAPNIWKGCWCPFPPVLTWPSVNSGF